MNIGFKDIGLIDGYEQFIRRIERNFKDVGMCYFFDLNNEQFLYKDDYRSEVTLRNLEYRKVFEEKDYSKFYQNNYNWLLKNENENYKIHKEQLNNFNYMNIANEMKLIDNETYSFLFLGDYMYVDGGIINSIDLYKRYKELYESNIDYSKKQIELKKIRNKLNLFIYSINSFNFKEEPLFEKEYGLYIVENADEYFDNCKDGCLTDDSSLIISKLTENLFI